MVKPVRCPISHSPTSESVRSHTWDGGTSKRSNLNLCNACSVAYQKIRLSFSSCHASQLITSHGLALFRTLLTVGTKVAVLLKSICGSEAEKKRKMSSRQEARETILKELNELEKLSACVRTWSHQGNRGAENDVHEREVPQGISRKKLANLVELHGRHNANDICTGSTTEQTSQKTEGKLQRFFKAIMGSPWTRTFSSSKLSMEASFISARFSRRLRSTASEPEARDLQRAHSRDICRINSCPERTLSQRSMMSGRAGLGTVVMDGSEAFGLLMALEVSARTAKQAHAWH